MSPADDLPAFTVLIPARLASTRLPGKPLADLGGRPMVVRCCERAAASGARRVVVAADDPGILAAVRAHGFEAVLTRGDHATGTDRLAEAANLLALPEAEIVVNLQGDEPLVDARLLSDVACRLAARPDAVMCTVAHVIRHREELLNPSVVKLVRDARGDAVWFSRAPLPWPRDAMATPSSPWPADYRALRHVGLYAYRRHFLPTYTNLAVPECELYESLEQLRALHHGFRIACVLAEAEPAAGVDTPEDLRRVQALFDRTPHVG